MSVHTRTSPGEQDLLPERARRARRGPEGEGWASAPTSDCPLTQAREELEACSRFFRECT